MGRDILVVEDDHNISDLIRMYLLKEGFDVRIAPDGARAVGEFQKKVPDLILLDIMLPVMDGWAVLSRIRETSRVPIIMLSAKSEVSDRIQGLEVGADDYIVKPFEMKELIARINAVLRRTEIPNDTSKKLVFDKLIINLDGYELIVNGKKVDTPPKELELLYHLASTPNKVYTRNQLLDEVWGFDYFGDSRTVDVHIKRLREKVENVSDQWELKTVWGVGYKFELLEPSAYEPDSGTDSAADVPTGTDSPVAQTGADSPDVQTGTDSPAVPTGTDSAVAQTASAMSDQTAK